jgi:4,5-dihydroxyphthalate decarboxylase
VMKEEIADREPWLVENLCAAFQQAKDQAKGSPELNPIAGGKPEDTAALMGDDPFKYGIGPNRNVLETFLKDVHDQHLVDRPMAVEELFAKATPDSFR